MKLSFEKWHGTGNDFIMVLDAESQWHPDETMIARICKRRTGVGADGLIILRKDANHDFHMLYFNSDGHQSSMCGNGGRCAIAFAARHGWAKDSVRFRAIDGIHEGRIDEGNVYLKMNDVMKLRQADREWVLDTGSPHYVRFTKLGEHLHFEDEAREIRQSPEFKKEGINVNFVEEKAGGELQMRTYERGVEAETLSCGTGAVAAALAAARKQKRRGSQKIKISTPGGRLHVQFRMEEDAFRDIWLIGPATYVYSGSMELS